MTELKMVVICDLDMVMGRFFGPNLRQLEEKAKATLVQSHHGFGEDKTIPEYLSWARTQTVSEDGYIVATTCKTLHEVRPYLKRHERAYSIVTNVAKILNRKP